MSRNDCYDIIIIGTGAGGGTIARRLADSGKRILILERGEYLPRERENWQARAVFEEQRYLARETWFDREDQPFRPYTHYCVGGNTKVYGAALLRMRQDDFDEVRHEGGISLAWPITYEELEPYYAEAEQWYAVHGQRGVDPHEPPASSPYPYPALAHEARIAELATDLRTLGLKPFACPLGVRLPSDQGDPTPYRLSNFDGYPDLTGVKADSHVVGIREALQRRNVTLWTGAMVQRLVTSASGTHVTGVEYIKDGERGHAHAEIVIVSCGAINSAALFLRSASDAHPKGLTNRAGLVGRHYMTHHNGILVAVSDVPNPSEFQKTLALMDFYRGDEQSALPLGTVQLMGKPDSSTLAWLRGDQLADRTLEEISGHSIDFFLTAEDLPSASNRISLREDGSIRVEYRDTNAAAYERLKKRLITVLESCDRLHQRQGRSTYLHQRLGVSGVSHQSGTLRMGQDPRDSVLDTNCRVHEVDNLYVVDASFFPSSSAVNPSLTIMANAIRVGDHLLERLGDLASDARSPMRAEEARA